MSLARSGERSERTAAQGSWSIGRCRSGLLEGVCDKVVTAQRPGDGAIPQERSECGIVQAYRSKSWRNILFRPRPATARTAVPQSAVEGETEDVERLHHRLRVGGAYNPHSSMQKTRKAPTPQIIKCSGTADERANTFPCLQRPKPSAVAKVR